MTSRLRCSPGRRLGRPVSLSKGPEYYARPADRMPSSAKLDAVSLAGFQRLAIGIDEGLPHGSVVIGGGGRDTERVQQPGAPLIPVHLVRVTERDDRCGPMLMSKLTCLLGEFLLDRRLAGGRSCGAGIKLALLSCHVPPVLYNVMQIMLI